MLMILGPVPFDLVNNLTVTDIEMSAAFAKHDIVGAPPLYEATGEDGASVTLTGVIHPEVLGVTGALARLQQAEAAQLPLPLMRGDGRPLGWHVIEKLRRADNDLNWFGVGKEIDFSVTLIRTGSPSASLAASILSLFS